MISLLLPDLRGGGAERVSLDLARAFARQGHGVELLLMEATGDFLPEAEAAFPVVDLAAPRVRQVLPALVHRLRRKPPDALLAAMWPLTVIAPLAARLAGFRGRVLVTEHNTLSVQYAAWGRAHRAVLRASMAAGYRLAHARAGVSGGVVDDIAALSGLPRRMFEVLHNPVTPRPAPDAQALRMTNALWSAPFGARILSVGSLKDQKNHVLLLRAFARMARADARLMLLGQGQNEGALRALAQELGVADRVIFAGFHADPSPFYATADLFALSSDYEGLPTVLIEALSFGLPIVSTDCPSGPAEILDRGRWGRLVPVRDADALAGAMDAALAAPVDRDALKRRAADFAPEIAAKKYLDLLGVS